MEDVEARFAHLLQPIRDLTKNWEVDVAAQLGEYLEEVRAARGSGAGRAGRGPGAAGRPRHLGVWTSGGALSALVLRLVPFSQPRHCLPESSLVKLAWSCHYRSLATYQRALKPCGW